MIRIILLSLLISFNTFAATTKTQAIQIYNNIVMENHFWVFPKLKFSDDPEMNAHVDKGTITINQGMLDNTNTDELALIIGHEIGHFRLMHSRSTPKNEFAADLKGCQYSNKAGYSCHKGKQVFKKFKQQYSDTHPHPKDRFKTLP